MRIAVIGCSHGTLDDIYASVEKCDEEARKTGEPGVDLMLCCGDFQAMRSPPDLQSMACPPKYRSLGHFHQYYAGSKKAPFLTIVIGGNHESSGYMWELYHGGWLAPDIYFLGYAGSVLVDGWLRIAGASGIWKGNDWKKGHFETVPYDDRTIRSVYHIREYEVARLLQLKDRGEPVDIFLSHDWPQGIEQYGDTEALIREKPFFRDEIASNTLGSPPLHALLTTLQPSYWFSAHLHVKFAALYHHSGAKTILKAYARSNGSNRRERVVPPSNVFPESAPVAVVVNPEEISLDDADIMEEMVEEESERKSFDLKGTDTGRNPEEIAIEDDELPLDEEPSHEQDVESQTGANAGEIREDNETCTMCEHKEDPKDPSTNKSYNPDEIELDLDDEIHPQDENRCSKGMQDVNSRRDEASAEQSRRTKFLALSKPGGGRDFLQIIDIQSPKSSSLETQMIENPKLPTDQRKINSCVNEAIAIPEVEKALSDTSASIPKAQNCPSLYFDPHWLAIVRALAPYLSLQYQAKAFPPMAEVDKAISDSYEWLKINLEGGLDQKIDQVQTFAGTAPCTGEIPDNSMLSWYTNPQTEAFCDMLKIPNVINPVPEGFREAQEAAKATAHMLEEKMERPLEHQEESVQKAELERLRMEALANVDEIIVDDDEN